jgi:hypothetical protein
MSSDADSADPRNHRAPNPAEVRESLGMMLGREVRVSDAGRIPPNGIIPAAVGPYVDDGELLCACAWVDLPLAAAMGAAMSMVPREQAEACLDTGVLPEEFQDNLHETLNIASALLNVDDATHLRIRPLELLESGLSEETLELLADPRSGGYYDVDIDGYGSGVLSFTLA